MSVKDWKSVFIALERAYKVYRIPGAERAWKWAGRNLIEAKEKEVRG